MGLRGLLVLSILPFLLGAILGRPFFGVLVFVFTTFVRPQNLTWGFEEVRFALCVSIACLVGFALKRRTFEPVRRPASEPWLWALLVVMTASSAASVYSVELALDWLSRFAKVVVFVTLLSRMLDRRERIVTTFHVLLAGLGLLALWAAQQHRSGNTRLEGVGNGGDLNHSNALACAFAMGLPLAVAGALNAPPRSWTRRAFALLAPLFAVDVVFTESRAGYLAVGCMAVWSFRFKELRAPVAALVLAGAVFWAAAAPAEYTERASTIVDQGKDLGRSEDGSIAGRIFFWQTALDLWSEHPILGVGSQNSMIHFKTNTSIGKVKSIHNTYIQLLCDNGAFALLLWLGAWLAALGDLAAVRRAGDARAARWAIAIEVSAVAFAVTGAFNSFEYLEMPYWLMTLGGALRSDVERRAGTQLAA